MAVPFTTAQIATIKANILASPDLNGHVEDDIAAAYNLNAAPDFWVWRTSVFESEYTRTTSEDGTTWSWPAYIARSLQEQNAWARLFMGGQSGCNPSLPNVRQGVADIFSGSASSAPAQRTHLLTMSRRRGTRLEKLLATGTGSTASPASLGYEGSISAQNVSDILAS